MDKIDLMLNDVPVCPYCGHRHLDLGDYFESKHIDCENCGKEFKMEIETEIKYTTSKLKGD